MMALLLLSSSMMLLVVDASAPVADVEGGVGVGGGDAAAAAAVKEGDKTATAETTTTTTTTKSDDDNNTSNNNNNAAVDDIIFKKKARFVHKTVIIPHDDKKFRGGEDAASTTEDMLVVVDGVGGWANKGVNPGLYSRKLTETITASFSAYKKEKEIEKDGGDGDGVINIDLKKLVHYSNHEAAAAHLGSATCTVVRLKDANTLETLNIGDSGYSIHRRSNTDTDTDTDSNTDTDTDDELQVVYASIPGQKGFNFPFQLGGQHGDQVHDEGVADGPNTHKLKDKDVIVVVSDGVIDNMDPHEYHDCINRYQWRTTTATTTTTSTTVEQFNVHYKGYFDEHELVSYSAVADCIARKAYFFGKDQQHYSPFARSAAKYGKNYMGGKHDDITVTVAQIEIAVVDDESGSGQQVFAMGVDVDVDEDDRHRNESIFVYKDEDGPIPPMENLPTIDDILNTILLDEKNNADEGGVDGEL